MGCDADVANLPLLLGFHERLVKPRAVARAVALRSTVQLVNVDVVRAKRRKARSKFPPKVIAVLRLGFRGDKDLLAHALKGDA